MDWLNQVGGVLRQLSGEPNQNTEAAYDQVAQHAPPNVVANGLAEAFRSDQTPPFPSMLGQLFGQSSGTQRANVLNSLLGALGPGALSGLLGSLGSHSGVAAGLTNVLQQGGTVTPEQAQQVPPEVVQQMAAHAEKQNPGIIDQLSQMYANTPGIVKTLGAGALAIALAKIGRDHKLL